MANGCRNSVSRGTLRQPSIARAHQHGFEFLLDQGLDELARVVTDLALDWIKPAVENMPLFWSCRLRIGETLDAADRSVSLTAWTSSSTGLRRLGACRRVGSPLSMRSCWQHSRRG